MNYVNIKRGEVDAANLVFVKDIRLRPALSCPPEPRLCRSDDESCRRSIRSGGSYGCESNALRGNLAVQERVSIL